MDLGNDFDSDPTIVGKVNNKLLVVQEKSFYSIEGANAKLLSTFDVFDLSPSVYEADGFAFVENYDVLYVTDGETLTPLNFTMSFATTTPVSAGEYLYHTDGAYKLFRINGQTGVNELVVDFTTLTAAKPSSWINLLTRFRDGVAFAADDGLAGQELWMTDGTLDGTGMVIDLTPGFRNGTRFDEFCTGNPGLVPSEDGEFLYFSAAPTTNGCADSTYRTDGTAEGTEKVYDWYVEQFIPVEDVMYMWSLSKTLAVDAKGALETIYDFLPGQFIAPSFAAVNDGVYLYEVDTTFFGTDVVGKTDGTRAGTSFTIDMPKGMVHDLFRDHAVLDGEVYFAFSLEEFDPANPSPDTGCELWKIDKDGNVVVVSGDLTHPDETNDSLTCPQTFTTVNGNLYFTKNNFFNGRELWVIEGQSSERVPGDSTLDGIFNSSDLVQVFQRGKYESGETASWEDGDWDGDGLFGTSDLVVAFKAGSYQATVEARLDDFASAIDAIFEASRSQESKAQQIGDFHRLDKNDCDNKGTFWFL
ncbi:MAG: hypothetical protein KDB27_02375 [Planctomycetales bacterium]|nr:hypothetical protein [Planctomycetales bacterium]